MKWVKKQVGALQQPIANNQLQKDETKKSMLTKF